MGPLPGQVSVYLQLDSFGAVCKCLGKVVGVERRIICTRLSVLFLVGLGGDGGTPSDVLLCGGGSIWIRGCGVEVCNELTEFTSLILIFLSVVIPKHPLSLH